MKTYRNTALFLASLLLLATAASCGDTQEDTSDTTARSEVTETEIDASTEEDALAPLGEKDLAGRTFTILDANDYPTAHLNMPGEISGEVINDGLYNRNAAIEARYNTKIAYVQIQGAAAGIGELRNSVMANDASYDAVISCLLGGALSTAATEGILLNLLEVPYMQLDKNHYCTLLNNGLQLNGRMYYTTGDFAPSIYQSPFCIYLNQKLLNDYDIKTDFFTLVRDGKWTLDELYAVTKGQSQDLNQDGKYYAEDDFFGLAHHGITLTTNAFLCGAGIKLSEEKDGTLVVDIMNEHTITVTDKLTDVMEECKWNDMGMVEAGAFKEGRALALCHQAGTASVHLRDMENDFIILPMPKYDAAQDSYYSLFNAWNDAFLSIPVTADAEFTGFMTEALALYSRKHMRPLAYETTMKDKAMRDENSAAMLDIIYDTIYLDFNLLYNFGGTTDMMRDVIIDDKDFASSYQKNENVMNKSITEFSETWLRAIEE